jgi:hypothetical protein
MNSFKSAVQNQTTTTTNGMIAYQNTSNSCVDLFFAIGASRGKNIIPQFAAAYAENPEYAIRIALWARDIRGGAGERQLFRNILQYLEQNDKTITKRVIDKIPEIGRFDDVLAFKTVELKMHSFELIKQALESKNGLCAKWLPRIQSINKYIKPDQHKLSFNEKFNLLNENQKVKFHFARDLCKYLNMNHETYRKTLASLTSVVETAMSANEWDSINFNHVPSLAATRYKKAFDRHTPKYAEYVEALANGDAKVNASAVYPYDVLKTLYNSSYTETEKNHIVAQWNALPNYVGDAAILPMVDVSGSMTCPTGNNKNLTCLQIAISLGLYLSSKNSGAFADMFLTFHSTPELLLLTGDIVQRYNQMENAAWGMNTNIQLAFEKVLKVATEGSVTNSEMPKYMLILSDMQFDSATRHSSTAFTMIAEKYELAGYQLPKIVFWNLNAHDNVPVKFDKSGVALVSGFSPAIMKSILSADEANFTPVGIMESVILNERYEF